MKSKTARRASACVRMAAAGPRGTDLGHHRTLVDAAEGGCWPTLSATWRSGPNSWRAAGRRCSKGVMRGRRTEVQYLNGYVSEPGPPGRDPHPVQRQGRGAMPRVPPGTLKPDPERTSSADAMLRK